jgi:hypothetical protein
MQSARKAPDYRQPTRPARQPARRFRWHGDEGNEFGPGRAAPARASHGAAYGETEGRSSVMGEGVQPEGRYKASPRSEAAFLSIKPCRRTRAWGRLSLGVSSGRAPDYCPILSDDPIMRGRAPWCDLLRFHKPVQGFRGGRFNAIGGALAAIDRLGWPIPACAARQLNREHRPARSSAHRPR